MIFSYLYYSSYTIGVHQQISMLHDITLSVCKKLFGAT